MTLSGGYLVLGRWRGSVMRMHLFAPVVWLLYVGNLPRDILAGALLGMATLILVHELGHAVLVRAYGAHVVAIDFLPFAANARGRAR